MANVTQCDVIGLERDDVVLAVLPFFHIYGMTVLLNFALSKRARLVTMPRFDLAEFLRIIEQHRTTWLFIAPPIAVALAKHPAVEAVDTSSVTVVFSGAAPLDAGLATAVAERLGWSAGRGLRHDRDLAGHPRDRLARRRHRPIVDRHAVPCPAPRPAR